jgi:hypothetical protein
MWPLFLLRDKGKRTEMTWLQHVATLKRLILHYITTKIVIVLFYRWIREQVNQFGFSWVLFTLSSVNNTHYLTSVSHSLSLSLPFSHTHTLSFFSLSRTHVSMHPISLSPSLTQTPTLYLSLSLCLAHAAENRNLPRRL